MSPLVSLYSLTLSSRQMILVGMIFLLAAPMSGQAQIMRSMPLYAGYLGYPEDFGPMPEPELELASDSESDDASTLRVAQSDEWDGWAEESEAVAVATTSDASDEMLRGDEEESTSQEDGEILEWAKDLDYESAEEEANEWVPYSEEFVLKPEESQGIKMTGMDPNSNLVLVEDRLLGKFSIRVQKIRVSHLELKWYDEAGKMIKYKEAKHLPIGTEIPYQIDKWPQGRYTLMIRVDDGNWQSKKIIKPKDAARL